MLCWTASFCVDVKPTLSFKCFATFWKHFIMKPLGHDQWPCVMINVENDPGSLTLTHGLQEWTISKSCVSFEEECTFNYSHCSKELIQQAQNDYQIQSALYLHERVSHKTKAMNEFCLVICPSFHLKSWSHHWLYRQHLGSDEVSPYQLWILYDLVKWFLYEIFSNPVGRLLCLANQLTPTCPCLRT